MIGTDADSISWARILLAFIVVFGLIALMGFVLKYVKLRGLGMPVAKDRARRMQVVETLLLDPRRRLMIVRCDEAEHILLLGGNQDLVVATNLEKHATSFQTKSGG